MFANISINFVHEPLECPSERFRVLGKSALKEREARADQTGIGSLVEHHGGQSFAGEAVAVGFFDARDEPVQAQAAQFVADAPGADVGFWQPEHLCKQWAELTVAEALDLEAEQHEDAEESLHARVAESQGAGTLAVHGCRSLQVLESGGPDPAVVAGFLDFEHAVIGGEADLAELRQVLQQAPDIEVIGVVDGGFRAQRGTFPAGLVILLEVRVFIIDVQ